TAYLALADAPVPRARLISLLFDSAQDPAAAPRWNLGQVRRLPGQPGALSGSVLSIPDDGAACFDVDVLAAARWQDTSNWRDSARTCSKACRSPTVLPSRRGCWASGAAWPR